MMANSREDIPISQIFGTILMSEVAVLLAVVVAVFVLRP